MVILAEREVMDFCEASGIAYINGLRHVGAGRQGGSDGRCDPRRARRRRPGRGARLCRDQHAEPPVLGEGAAGSRPASRPPARASTSAMSWFPTSRPARPDGSTPGSTASASKAENLIKLHKAQLASDRTSCRAATANQMRLVLHTAAYWLVLAVREAIPKAHALAKAEFAAVRVAAAQGRRSCHRGSASRVQRSPLPPPAPTPTCTPASSLPA